MAPTMFELILKSSLDFYCNQITEEFRGSGDPDLAALLAVGLDDLVNVDEAKKVNPAVMWEINGLSPMPRDPLYTVQISVGVKTTNDDANYLQAKVASLLADKFKVDDTIELLDYSVAVEDLPGQPVAGKLLITEVTSTPMQFDNQSGLKLLGITGRLLRYV